MKKFQLLLLALVLGATSSLAWATTINFDDPQANYTPTPNVDQVIDDQFIPLGIVFRDADFPSLGAVGGNHTGGVGSDPVHLYSNNGSGEADTLPDLTLTFVEPTAPGTPASVLEFSAMVTDSDSTTFSAYDAGGNLLGSVSAVGSLGEILTLTGIGDISRIEVRTPSDNTALDDFFFTDIAGAPPAAPVPVTSPIGLALLVLGLLSLGSVILRRRRTN